MSKTAQKYYTSEHINTQFSKLTKDEKIIVLYDALCIMQSHNGRTTFMCIAIALGYDNHEGENNTYTK